MEDHLFQLEVAPADEDFSYLVGGLLLEQLVPYGCADRRTGAVAVGNIVRWSASPLQS